MNNSPNLKEKFGLSSPIECDEKKKELENQKVDLGNSKEEKKQKNELNYKIELLKELKKQLRREGNQQQPEEPERQDDKNLTDNEKEAIKEIFQGNKRYSYYLDNMHTTLYKDSNIELVFDKISKSFEAYFFYYKDNELKSEIFAGFNSARRIKRKDVKVMEKVEQEDKDILEVANVSGDEDNRLKEYDLSHNNWERLGKDLQIGNQKGQYLAVPRKLLYNDLQNLSLIPKTQEKVTDSYGVLDNNMYVLPPYYKLNKNNEGIKTNDVKSFETLLSEDLTNEDKLREIAQKFKEYLEKSRATQLAFYHSLTSVFRYYLMSKGLKEFSYFGLKSKIGNKGKSTRLKIVNNLFLYGLDSDGVTQNELGGTGIRLNSYQTVIGNLLLDDPSALNTNNLVGLLKSFATSQYLAQTKFNSAQKPITYKVLRGITCSFNQINIKDTNLVRRFIFVDMDKEGVSEYEEQPTEEEVIYLERNIRELGKYFWNNINNFYPSLDTQQTQRENSKLTVLNIGFEIANKLFKSLGVGELNKFDFAECITGGEEFIATQDYEVKKEIESQIIKLTEGKIKTTDNENLNTEIEEWNIYDLLKDEGVSDDIRYKVLRNSSKKGIYLTKNRDILVTSQALNHLHLKGVRLRNTTDLKEHFEDNEFYIKTGKVGGVKTYEYGTKKGFVIKKSTNEETEEEKENEEKEGESKEEREIKEVSIDEALNEEGGDLV